MRKLSRKELAASRLAEASAQYLKSPQERQDVAFLAKAYKEFQSKREAGEFEEDFGLLAIPNSLTSPIRYPIPDHVAATGDFLALNRGANRPNEIKERAFFKYLDPPLRITSQTKLYLLDMIKDAGFNAANQEQAAAFLDKHHDHYVIAEIR